MKTILTSIAAGGLLAAVSLAQTPPHYNIIELGPLAGTFSQGFGINDNRLVAGASAVRDGTTHAAFWGLGLKMDIGAPGMNSGVGGVNRFAQASVGSEIAVKDPNGENFCAYGTGLQCRPFVWQGGVLTALPTLGGYNGTVGQVNNHGEVSGFAENSTRDPECPSAISVSGTGPQVLDYEPVVWGPGQGQVRRLQLPAGDTVGMAIWINDNGQAVGATGRCGNTVLPPLAYGPHAVLWEKDGSVTDLGNLGAAVVNMALSINNQGQVAGTSSLSVDSQPNVGIHAFLWTKGTGMRDLGALPGDVGSVGLGLDESGNVAGVSFDKDGNPRAVLWQNGVMSDLNTLIPASSPLYLMFAEGINSSGEIVGFGAVKSTCTADPSLCEIHAFLAIPTSAPAVHANAEIGQFALPENVRAELRQRLGFNRLGRK
jgi:probable HAF family extracellular repeat protein